MNEEQLLIKAQEGDIQAYESLFSPFRDALKSYLYRMLTDRNDAEDLAHDAYIKGYEKLSNFKADSSLKTWIFQIATNMAYNHLKKLHRWTPDVSEKAKHLVFENHALAEEISNTASGSNYGRYEITEHIDTCFTCISKNLPIENQVALLLKDVYDFRVKEIVFVLGKTEGVVKYLLQDARKTMMEIFDQRCALISKKGVCNQCSELNGWLNPKQDQQQALVKLDLVKGSKKYDRDQLYALRQQLVKNIDPLKSEGHELQEVLMKCNRMAMGEAVT